MIDRIYLDMSCIQVGQTPGEIDALFGNFLGCISNNEKETPEGLICLILKSFFRNDNCI